MKLAVSSIAWEPSEDATVADLLKSENVGFVELAPTKIWPEQIKEDPASITDEQIEEALNVWRSADIKPVAMQSMLYLRPDLKLFESESNRDDTKEYLMKFIDLASRMGISRMVFGSPKNRQKGDMTDDQAMEIATSFFSEIGDYAASKSVVFCIEPNAPQYACDFVTTAGQGYALVQAVNSTGFRLHLDAACMALAGDDLEESVMDFKDLLAHYHISSPMLDPVVAREDVHHQAAADALRKIGYDDVVSIEMRPSGNGENVPNLKEAITFAKVTY